MRNSFSRSTQLGNRRGKFSKNGRHNLTRSFKKISFIEQNIKFKQIVWEKIEKNCFFFFSFPTKAKRINYNEYHYCR